MRGRAPRMQQWRITPPLSRAAAGRRHPLELLPRLTLTRICVQNRKRLSPSLWALQAAGVRAGARLPPNLRRQAAVCVLSSVLPSGALPRDVGIPVQRSRDCGLDRPLVRGDQVSMVLMATCAPVCRPPPPPYPPPVDNSAAFPGCTPEAAGVREPRRVGSMDDAQSKS